MNIFNDPRHPSTATHDEIIASERREQALNDAYADGRADQFEQECEFLSHLLDVIDRSLAGAGGARIEARDLILGRLPPLERRECPECHEWEKGGCALGTCAIGCFAVRESA